MKFNKISLINYLNFFQIKSSKFFALEICKYLSLSLSLSMIPRSHYYAIIQIISFLFIASTS